MNTPTHLRRRLGSILLGAAFAMMAFTATASAVTIPADGRSVRLEAETFTHSGASGPVANKHGGTLLKMYGNGWAGTWVQNASAGNKYLEAIGLYGQSCYTQPIAYISVYSHTLKRWVFHTPFTLGPRLLSSEPQDGTAMQSGAMQATPSGSNHTGSFNAPANDWLFIAVGFWNDDYRPGICDSNVLIDAIDVRSLVAGGTVGTS